jgi:hypothetical protein
VVHVFDASSPGGAYIQRGLLESHSEAFGKLGQVEKSGQQGIRHKLYAVSIGCRFYRIDLQLTQHIDVKQF